MKIRRNQQRHQRGSILVICLVIAGVGTIGAAAFFSLIQAKGEEALAREEASLRRARAANSAALAKEVMLQRSSTTLDGSIMESSATLSGDWGTCQTSDFTSLGATPLGYSASVRLHKTGAVADTAFSADIDGSVLLNGNKSARQFQAKSIHPALGGDLLVVESQKASGLPAIEFTGSLSVEGRAVFWNSNYATSTASLKADRVIQANPAAPSLGFVDTSDNAITPDNLPLPPSTSGFVNGAPAFNGVSHLIDNPDIGFNDYLDTIPELTGNPLPGDQPFVECSGAASNPTSANDATLLALITAQIGLLDSVRTALQPYAPLSSAVLTTAISQATTTADATVLLGILEDNQPLPEDVLFQLVNGSTPLTPVQVRGVLEQNPVAVAIDSTGAAYIDLDDPAAQNVIIRNGLSSLTLRGQEDSSALAAAAGMSPLVIVAYNDSTGGLPLASLNLMGANARPLILALRKYSDNTDITVQVTGTTAFPEWRAIMDLDNVGLRISASTVSTVTFKGGIRTNRSIIVADGATVLARETDPDVIAALRPLASRNAWVETFTVNNP